MHGDKRDTLSIFERAEMARRRGQRKGHLFERSGLWMLRYRVDTPEIDERTGRPRRERITIPVAHSKGPEKVGSREAQRIAWDEYLSKLDQASLRPSSMRTLAEFVKERYAPDVIENLKPSGKSFRRSILKQHVLPALGEVRLRELSPAHVQAMVNLILSPRPGGKGLSVQTAVHAKKQVSAVISHAKAMGWFAGEKPTEAVRTPEMKRKPRRALRWEQVCAITKLLPEPVATLFPFLALTGLRIAEAMGLRWKNINLTRDPIVIDTEVIPPMCLAVRENYVMGRHQSLKTAKSSRNVPIPEWFIPRLIEHALRSEFRGLEDPVFTSRTGRPLDQHNAARRKLKPAAAAAGFGTPAVPKSKSADGKAKPAESWVSWHCMRHTNATLADAAGLTVAERMRILGHASPEMSLHYTHAELELLRKRWDGAADPKLLQ